MLTKDLIDQAKEYCRNIDLNSWELAWLLAPAGLSNEEFADLAQQVGKKVSTLKLYETVGREVPRDKYDSNHPFGVYAALVRVKDEKARQTILNRRSKWKIEDMEAEVRRYHQEISGTKSSKPQPRAKSGMKVGDIKIRAQLSSDGRLKITVESPVVDEPKVVDWGSEIEIGMVIEQ